MNIDSELDISIERRIIIGLVVSTEYLKSISAWWNSDFIVSEEAFRISEWVWEYYEEYQEAPGINIENIYLVKKDSLPDDVAEEIGDNILPSLSDEYARSDKFNIQYLLDKTIEYFRLRHIEIHNEHERQLILDGKTGEAEKLRFDYVPFTNENEEDYDGVYLGSEEHLKGVDLAFSEQEKGLIEFPGPFGDLINRQLVRDGFVSFLAPEKRGKSFILLEMAFRALRQNNNVVLFDAGDMSRLQHYRRMTEYITGRSRSQEKLYIPVRDCLMNQVGSCVKSQREGSKDMGITGEEDITRDLLIAFANDDEYKPCRNCELHEYGQGSMAYKIEERPVITKEQAKKINAEWYNKYSKRFKLSTFSNGQLTVKRITSLLDRWEKIDGFVPDVIIIDYADLLVSAGDGEFRHNVDSAWKGLRGLSQQKHCLVLTATQADAKSMQQNNLNLSNFSEDKRKFSHITAMYSMNRDPAGVEAKLGLMRYAELLVRDGDPYPYDNVYVMENRTVGKAFEGSFIRRNMEEF